MEAKYISEQAALKNTCNIITWLDINSGTNSISSRLSVENWVRDERGWLTTKATWLL